MEGIGVVGGGGSDANVDGEELQEFEKDRIFASTQGPRENCARAETIGFETVIFIVKCLCFNVTTAIFLIHICYGRPL